MVNGTTLVNILLSKQCGITQEEAERVLRLPEFVKQVTPEQLFNLICKFNSDSSRSLMRIVNDNPTLKEKFLDNMPDIDPEEEKIYYSAYSARL